MIFKDFSLHTPLSNNDMTVCFNLEKQRCSPSTLVNIILTVTVLSLSGCYDGSLADTEQLVVPKVLKVPPVKAKQLALQGLLDGLLTAAQYNERVCDQQTNQTNCEYNYGGSVEMEGFIQQAPSTANLLGREVEQIEQDVSLKSIILQDFRFFASTSPQKIAAPNDCKHPVKISGEGKIHGTRESILTKEDEWFTLSAGGVIQGNFTLLVSTDPPILYEFQFPEPGFYYRRDLIPIKLTRGSEASPADRMSALQISVIHSGKLILNEQAYSYQDVFVEILNYEAFWEIECDRPYETQQWNQER